MAPGTALHESEIEHQLLVGTLVSTKLLTVASIVKLDTSEGSVSREVPLTFSFPRWFGFFRTGRQDFYHLCGCQESLTLRLQSLIADPNDINNK